MPRCDLCNREFKNGAGLAGHYQLKHASERSLEGFDPSAVAASKRQEQSASEPSPTGSEGSGEGWQQRLDDRLERIEEAVVLGAGLKHEHGPDCEDCQDWAEQNQENPDDGQPLEHQHGDDCNLCVHEQLKGVQRSAVWHDKNVPGAKEAREHAMTGEKMVTIVDDRPATANTEDLTDTQFKLFAAGVMKEAGERGIR